MSIVRRLFSLKLSAEKSDNDDNYQRSNPRRVLKYDQPLFREKEINTKHEELPQLLDFQLQRGRKTPTSKVLIKVTVLLHLLLLRVKLLLKQVRP